MSYAEIDQSGKIEQFNMDTVVALSNDREYSIMLPKKVKQEFFLDNKTKIRNIKYKLFALAIFFCLKEVIEEENRFVICREYEGKERIIITELIRQLNKHHLKIDPKTIRFSIITKKSSAHKLALSVFTRKENPDLVLSEKDLEKIKGK